MCFVSRSHAGVASYLQQGQEESFAFLYGSGRWAQLLKPALPVALGPEQTPDSDLHEQILKISLCEWFLTPCSLQLSQAGDNISEPVG